MLVLAGDVEETSGDPNAVRLAKWVRGVLEDEMADLVYPQEEGWVAHDGRSCPVPPEADVLVKLRGGYVSANFSRAGFWGDGGTDSNWNHDRPTENDIVAYRLAGEPS